LILGLCVLAPPADAQSTPPDQPNIILILADDLGYSDVGAFGATDIVAPNIDRIANEGVRFTSFYSAPSCSLSRTMLMTGSYQPRSSASRNYLPSSSVGINEREVTLGELMQQAGYATAIFGKWHLGDHYQFRPQRHGFDEFFGIPYSNDMWPFHPQTARTADEHPRLTAARERAELTGYSGQGSYFPLGEGFPNLPLYDGDTIVEFNSEQNQFGAAFIDRALDFIERHRDQRFFAYLPLTAPHVPLHPGPDFLGTSTRDLYGDTVQEIDAGIGRILAKLVELGIDNQTLVLILSDNGPWLEYGIDGGTANPLSGGKGSQFEGGIRVPAILRWPGGLASGGVIDTPVGVTDILPTLSRLAGAQLPTDRTLDGLDVWSLVTGQTSSLPRDAIFSFDEVSFGVVDLAVVRSQNWKLHVATSSNTVSALALYDLVADLAETINLRSSRPGIVSNLVALGQQAVDDIVANQRPLGVVSLSGAPFAQKPGFGNMVVMEAEHFHEQQARGGKSWQTVSLRHSSAEESIQALPNSGTTIQTDYVIQSPHLRYRVVFEVPGRYYIWVRGRGASTGDDSLHVGLNGQAVSTGERIEEIFDHWTWSSTRNDGGRAYVNVPTAGEHVVDVWMREDGLILDKLLLTTDVAFEPQGKGLVESRQSYDGLAVPPIAVDDGPFIADEGGVLQGAPNVLDNDGGDPRNDPISAVLVSAPANASLFDLMPDGTFTYQHDGSETTDDSFTYTANDIDGASNIATVSLEITPVNDVPVITLLGAAIVNLKVGDAYVDAGASAQDAEDGDISDGIIAGGDVVDTGTPGTYLITYDVTDSEEAAAEQVTRTVNVAIDNVPVITLIGDALVEVAAGDSYTDAGATAADVEDGDITPLIVVGGDVIDTNTVGSYVITYNVMDSGGNMASEVTRTIEVVSNERPVITLNGSAFIRLSIGDAYTDPGATATDTEDGDITADIVVGGDVVDTATPGTYVITYNVTDSAGNAADEVIRSVNVNPSPQASGGGGGLLGLWELAGLALLLLLRTRAIRPYERD
jgi:arylsulfatase A-like enzyme